MKTSFRKFKTATLPETTPDPIGFFESIYLAGLEGEFVRITAAIQRRYFGCIPFGKLAVCVENGTCRTIKAMDFGRDFDTQEAYWSMADNAWRSTHNDSLNAQFPRA